MNLFERKHVAISTVVATALMLSAVAVLGTGLVAWSNTNLRTYENSLSASSADKTNKFNEFLTIENVWFRHHPQSLNITLSNVGSIGVNVTQIKFNDTSIIYNVPNALGKILPGNFTKVQPQIQWHNGSSIKISVTTQRGSIFTTQVTP